MVASKLGGALAHVPGRDGSCDTSRQEGTVSWSAATAGRSPAPSILFVISRPTLEALDDLVGLTRPLLTI